MPSPFWISDRTVHPSATSSASPFSFFQLQPLKTLPIKIAWFLRPVSSHTLPLEVRRWWEETAFHPPLLLKSRPLLRVFPDHAADTQSLIRSQIPNSNYGGKNRAKIKTLGFHTFLWLHQKYWLEIQRVVKLIVEQSQKNSGQHWGIPTMRISFCPLTNVSWLQLKPVRDSTLTLSTNIREQGTTLVMVPLLVGPYLYPQRSFENSAVQQNSLWWWKCSVLVLSTAVAPENMWPLEHLKGG